ncbi:ATP-binding protein [Streptomyces sp. JV184]|uniref:ATP-binding protein n=1 Tax=Streptomyces sp. JV184 TaxID=858637 RepID=UPI002E79921C|nr:ATP-binding protein [Streptomyces sp. JV184]MEE1744078.1 ATP-binding protein [Streptomyces sp. JV184]
MAAKPVHPHGVMLALSSSEDPGLARAQDALRAFLLALPLTGAEQSAVHVAVLEAMVNAVRHGHSTEQRAATLDLSVVAGQIVVTVTDHGPGFDPSSCPDPLAPERMQLPHGRGVLLMRALMDDVEFTFPPGDGTRVTLRRTISPPAPTGAAQPARGATHMRPIVKVEGSTGRLILIGPFDFNLHRDFKQTSQELLDNAEVKVIQIDFDQVPHLDSSALGMLLLLHNGAAGQNKSVELINCNEAVMGILEAAKLTKTFTIR